jgi:MFS family permease
VIAYYQELRQNWRPLLAATFGLGTGSAAITLYAANAIAPRMIADLGWTKAQFAALGMLSLINAFMFPVAGRMADVFGVRKTVFIGIVSLPLAYLALAHMTGPIWQYFVIQLACGLLTITTSTTIYSRVAVEYTKVARGLALAIVASGPAMTGAILGPIMNHYVEANGWRSAYLLLALYAAVAGVITLFILPRNNPTVRQGLPARRRARDDYPVIARSPAFWLLVSAMLLCNLPQIVVMTQLKLVLIQYGVSVRGTSIMLSALPLGVIAGRFVTGFSLDRLPSHVVGFISLSLPSVGLFIFAAGPNSLMLLTFATVCIGFSVGAEGDLIAYIVARKFGINLYSSVMGLLTMAISLSAALGSGLSSLSLKLTGGSGPYMIGCGSAVLVGSLLMLLLRTPREGESRPVLSASLLADSATATTIGFHRR